LAWILETPAGFGRYSLCQLGENTSGTEMAAGSEAYQASLVFFASPLKMAAAQDIPGAKAVYGELKTRFPGGKRKRDGGLRERRGFEKQKWLFESRSLVGGKQVFNIGNRRFVGSKQKLADWIVQTISDRCQGKSFFEVFAGTSIISSQMIAEMERVVLNDTLLSNNIIYEAFYGKGGSSHKKLDNYKTQFNNINTNQNSSGWFTKNYGGKYFGNKDCETIETIRNILEAEKPEMTKKEYTVLLASLIYSMDKIANTVGHFDAYIQIPPADHQFAFELIEPFDTRNVKIEIYCDDANKIANKIQTDIAYIDPPYNSRQYCQFYHIYETLVKWDNPELFGTALKRKGEALSDYCRIKAPEVFADLIENLRCNYLAVSYNNTYTSKSSSSRNKIQLGEITNILSKYGKVKTLSKSHKAFNTGKTELPDHKEYLFIVKKDGNKNGK
jgi:adenine-specific DNA-methyltransferase